MLVTELRLRQFMLHKETVLALPTHGLTVVRGSNGSGKSSFIEAVGWALWGRTLRGTPPWRVEKEDCGAVVTVASGDAAIVVSRTRKRGAAKLVFEPGGEQYATATLAQTALNTRIGEFDTWRRTHVFSSADAAVFSAATDAERKRLLEGLLGLGRFDIALKRCKEESSAATKELMRSRTQAAVLARDVSTALQELNAAQAKHDEAQSQCTPVDELRKQLTAATADTEDATSEIDALRAAAASLDAAYEAADAACEAARAELEPARTRHALAQRDLTHARQAVADARATACVTCGRDFDAATQQATLTAAVSAQRALDVEVTTEGLAVAGLEHTHKAYQAEVLRVGRDCTATRRSIDNTASALRQAEQAITRLNAAFSLAVQFDAVVASLADDAQKRSAALDASRSAAEVHAVAQRVLESTCAEFDACERVLGLRGVRAAVLARALVGIERLANVYLSKLMPGASLKLSSSTTQQSGAVVDAISLDVTGPGGGHGYGAASGGERRRIDVALLLALAELAAGASGVTAGTLWLDEVFDALDSDGIDSVCEVLFNVAKARPVVVITHVDALADRLAPSARVLVIDSGRVQ